MFGGRIGIANVLGRRNVVVIAVQQLVDHTLNFGIIRRDFKHRLTECKGLRVASLGATGEGSGSQHRACFGIAPHLAKQPGEPDLERHVRGFLR